jgi:hypothetical protein
MLPFLSVVCRGDRGGVTPRRCERKHKHGRKDEAADRHHSSVPPAPRLPRGIERAQPAQPRNTFAAYRGNFGIEAARDEIATIGRPAELPRAASC